MSVIVKDLVHVYNPGSPFESTALNGVNLEIEKGEFIGLIGHTGSGKSTLIQHLNGLLKPSSGVILINDLDITKKLKRSCALLDIVLLDHLIITKDNYFSFADEGLL